MEEKIAFLYEKISFFSMVYLDHQKIGNVEAVKELIPQINEFVGWFMSENVFVIEEELYKDMCINLVEIIKDVSQALENEDRVLMHDTITYGFLPYVALFVEQEE